MTIRRRKKGYGMSESTAVGARGLNNGKFSKYMSIGLMVPNMQAKVVNWNFGYVCLQAIVLEKLASPDLWHLSWNKERWYMSETHPFREGEIMFSRSQCRSWKPPTLFREYLGDLYAYNALLREEFIASQSKLDDLSVSSSRLELCLCG
ncbi:hypothetical protein IFM89_021413 [Coptis chinensis]|uniref:Uncharacterized protein n=1 Tax=Coptis chinensis TaxID=261450 RepID=A0A835IFU9_9MAGN|nr:hypothetical protein IFM89_021413 [Coptis chinensis]